jgi:hypothetical protein
MEKAAKELTDLYEVMEEDFVMACELASKEQSSPIRQMTAKRFAIRAGAALVEGFVYQLRLYCIAAHEKSAITFDEYEVLALREKQVKVVKGKVKLSNNRQSIEDGIDFVFSMYAKACGSEYRVNKEGNDWKNFQLFFDIRNNLMHLKSLADFNMLEEDFFNACNGIKYFERMVINMHNSTKLEVNS